MSKVILIDPFDKSISYVEMEMGDFQAIYDLLGCEMFDAEGFGDQGDVLIFDDTGLLKNTEEQAYFGFQIRSEKCPMELVLSGRVLIAGEDVNENWTSSVCTIKDLVELECVVWLDHDWGASYAKQFHPSE